MDQVLSIKHSGAERIVALGAVALLFASTSLMALLGASVLLTLPPFTISDTQITLVLGLYLIWHGAWWLLTAHTMSKPFGVAHQPRGRTVRVLAVAGMAFAAALGVILDPAVRELARSQLGAPRFRWLMEIAAFYVLPFLAATQVCVGAPLLARFEPDHARSGRNLYIRGILLSAFASATAALLPVYLILSVVEFDSAAGIVSLPLLAGAALLPLTLLGSLLRTAIDLCGTRSLAPASGGDS